MIKHDYKNIQCFVYPNAYLYCDTTIKEYGDYMTVAMVVFHPAEIHYNPQSIIPEKLKSDCENDLQRIKNHEKIEISATGQFVQY